MKLACGCLGVLALLGDVALAQEEPTPQPRTTEAQFIDRYCQSDRKAAIPAGSEQQARLYYADLSEKIGLEIRDPVGTAAGATTLDDVVRFLGYGTEEGATPLSAKELQDGAPAELMDAARLRERFGVRSVAAGDVLVARFFAPKISDFSQPVVSEAGWRKLVRLRALPESAARVHGLAYGIILFNFFAPIDSPDPFAGASSVNTQTILVGADERQTLYWLDFGKAAEGSKLSHELDAFFDAGHIPKGVEPKGGATAYFVPCACAACHGGLQLDFRQKPPAPETHLHEAVLDYLDTDHWQERVSPGDDFDALQAPVIFDPGGFAVIQQLNQEILLQNIAAQPQSMLRRAAEHWLTWHLGHGEERQHLFDRALRNPGGGAVWDRTNAVDAELLPKLNRFCFRCHGTVLFDVLDKQMVLDEASKLVSVLRLRTPADDPRVPMPPDRSLRQEELKRLQELIINLK